jgi:hypothetical protein
MKQRLEAGKQSPFRQQPLKAGGFMEARRLLCE